MGFYFFWSYNFTYFEPEDSSLLSNKFFSRLFIVLTDSSFWFKISFGFINYVIEVHFSSTHAAFIDRLQLLTRAKWKLKVHGESEQSIMCIEDDRQKSNYIIQAKKTSISNLKLRYPMIILDLGLNQQCKTYITTPMTCHDSIQSHVKKLIKIVNILH